MRRAWFQILLAPLVAACGLVAGIEDINVVESESESDGGGLPRDDSGKLLPDGAVDPRTDAEIDSGTDSADVKKTRCDPLTPFGAPVPLTTLNSGQDDASPRFSSDELTVYFSSNRPGHLGAGSIYIAKRTALGDTFGPSTVMPAINSTTGLVYHPAPSGDGLKIFLMVDFGGPTGTDLYVASRLTTGVDFGTPTLLAPPVSSNNGFEFIPFVTPDGVNLYFSSNRAGPFQLYQSIAAGPPALVDGVGTGNGAVSDTGPVMSADLRTIYFASTRTNPAAMPYNLFVARRDTPTGTFGMPTAVPELNDPNAAVTDVPSWLSADDCRLYMTSDRLTPGGPSDVFVATRVP